MSLTMNNIFHISSKKKKNEFIATFYPVYASQSISNIPVFYSKLTVMTQDSY